MLLVLFGRSRFCTIFINIIIIVVVLSIVIRVFAVSQPPHRRERLGAMASATTAAVPVVAININ